MSGEPRTEAERAVAEADDFLRRLAHVDRDILIWIRSLLAEREAAQAQGAAPPKCLTIGCDRDAGLLGGRCDEHHGQNGPHLCNVQSATGPCPLHGWDHRGAAPRAEGLPQPGIDMTPEQQLDWWERAAYSEAARAERAEDALRNLTQRVAEATIRFPTLTEDSLLRDSFHAASRLIEGVDRE